MSTFVRHNAHRFPDEVALQDLDSGERTTWLGLEARVSAIASVLVGEYAIAPGDRIAFFAADRPITFEVLLASMRIGAIFVPLNRRLSATELQTLGGNAKPALLLHDATWSAPATTLAAALGLPAVDLDADLEPLIATGSHPPVVDVAVGPDEPIMLLYTSGTTGLPKGAIVTEAMMLAQTMNVIDAMGIAGPPAKYLSVLPLFHAAGILAIALPLLFRGGCVVVGAKFEPSSAALLLADPAQGFTHFNGPPVMYQMIADHAPSASTFAHLRHGMVGGGKLSDELADFYFSRGWELQVGWGATEMGPSTTLMPAGESVKRAETVGQMLAFTRLRVVADDGRDVAFGEEGEAWVNGPSISPAYWRQTPEQDENHRDGWYRSGDAVSVDEDGFVTFRGRYKDMYKSGGENVFAAEVENVLVEHRDIAEAAVIGIGHPRWGEVGKAILVLAPNADIDDEAIIAFCRGRLAGYKVPAELAYVDELPRNVTGKVQKNELRVVYGDATRPS